MSKGVELIWSEFRRHVQETVAAILSWTSLSLILGGGIVAVVAGPFGTFQTMGPVLRAAYWSVVLCLGVAIGGLSRAALLTLCGRWPPLALDLGMSLATATLLTPLIHVLRAAFDPVLARSDLSPASIWVNTLAFVTTIVLLRRRFGLETGPATPEPPSPRLARRLSEPLQGAAILRLSGRDHSVEVVTDGGTETLRLRLSDAIDEMEPVAGLCTHRSHWVALAAIAGHERKGNRTWLRLVNGDRVPVTRTYAPRLEELGLIPPRDGATGG